MKCVGEGVSWETPSDIYICIYMCMPSVYLDIGDV